MSIISDIIYPLNFKMNNLSNKLKFPFHNCHQKKIIFIHIPKCAGTSVAQAVYGVDIGHLTASYVKIVSPRSFQNSFVFSVVRNPVDRLLSTIRYSKRIYHERGGRDKFSLYAKVATAEMDDIIWSLKNSSLIKNHFLMPQTAYLCDNRGRNLVSNLYSFSNLHKLELDLNLNLRVTNTSTPDSKNASPLQISEILRLYKDDNNLYEKVSSRL